MVKKYSFKTDFEEGCHPRILTRLLESNREQQAGYGNDDYTLQARQIISQELNLPDSDIYFVAGGTQANKIVISSALRNHEAVIAPMSGHIQQYEAGAIESTGHRIETVERTDGKLRPVDIDHILNTHFAPHTVQSRMVYLTHATELGTIYQKEELSLIRQKCDEHGLYLYIDGARIGAAVMSEKSDCSLQEIAALADIFYIGGTKNGALLGEAIVINNDRLKEGFESNIKRQGGLMAKGRILGIQFYELFRDGLYYELAQHANTMASRLSAGLQQAGISFYSDSHTNQLFVIFPDWVITKLSEEFDFYTFFRYDDSHSVSRLITSWATPPEWVDLFVDAVRKLISTT